MLEALGVTDFDAVIVTQPNWSRAMPVAEVAAAAASLGVTAEVVPDAVSALRRAKSVTTGDDLVLVTGSLYVVGEVRPAARSVITD